jgi:hypothetical protein
MTRPCTFPSKTKRDSGSIIQFIGGGSVIVGIIVIVSVTGDRAGEVFLVGHEEGGDRSGLVPLGSSEAGSAENLPRLFTRFFKGVAVEGCDSWPPCRLYLLYCSVLTGEVRGVAR